MERTSLAPLVGVLACLAFLSTLAVPFQSAGAGLYYETGAVNPLLGGLLALIAVIVFAAGRQGRTDPALAAGVTLALGLLAAGMAVAWALTARTDVLSITRYHRHALVVTASTVPLVAAWYARELRVW
ncbi:hypothetical protein [Halorhabdus sp. CUG00001]|uniref:DUF7548 family protein n=1 Tax=Halorhabdus sp. CUG00001 TaxID=2600297 RepID=UPI00131DF062|nr:hypothetical protein [Halorhabdus sp. CUG00001]